VFPITSHPSTAVAPETHANLCKLNKIGQDNPAARDGHRRDTRRSWMTRQTQRVGIAVRHAKQINRRIARLKQ
jgi:hypothetical protein